VTRQKRSTSSGEAATATSWSWGGVSLWRSLMRLDLIDELQLSLFPYVKLRARAPGCSTASPQSYRLDLVSSTASSNGIVELQYRRHR
jgi:hypothetical protein